MEGLPAKAYRKTKMATDGNKNPLSDLMDKLRSALSPGGHPKKKIPGRDKTRFNVWYFVLAVILIFYLQRFFFSVKVQKIPYSQFKKYIAEGKVAELTIGPENIEGTLTGSTGATFTTVRVNDPGLVKELDERKVNYSGRYENKFLTGLLSWVLPLGIFFLIWRMAMEKMGSGMGVMSFSKSKRCFSRTIFLPAKITARRKPPKSTKRSPAFWKNPINACEKSSRSDEPSSTIWPVCFPKRKAQWERSLEGCCRQPLWKWRPHRPINRPVILMEKAKMKTAFERVHFFHPIHFRQWPLP